MADERRYQEEEVKEILDRAADSTEVGRPAVSRDTGLTLSEIQEAGLEVGMDPGRIAKAALAVDTRREIAPRRTHLGAPISVGRIVDLPRALTDREWQVLLGELRDTFGARGHVESHGSVREWNNGNLHAFMEPTATGHRLRLTTLKETAPFLLTGGAVALGFGLLLVGFFTMERLGGAAAVSLLMAIVGGTTLVANKLRLPRWARTRAEQMEYIAGRVEALVEQAPDREEPSTRSD